MLRDYLNFMNTEGARRQVAEHPYRAFWVYLVLITMAMVAALHANNLLKFSPITRVGILVGVNFIGLLYFVLIVTWLLKRQEKKDWGVPLPEEPRVLLVRPGIWWGLMIATVYQIALVIIFRLAFQLTHIHILHIQVTSIASIAIALRALTNYYQIPKRRYLIYSYIIPLIALALIGVVVAVALGWYAHYHKQQLEHEHLTAKEEIPQSFPAPKSSMGAPVAMSAQELGHPLPNLAAQDMHCMKGEPLIAPRRVTWEQRAVVIQIVPRRYDEGILRKTERYLHGWIEPQYQQGKRVVVQPVGHESSFLTVVAPVGFSVHPGQLVEIESGRASRTKPCEYIPDRIIYLG